MKAVIKPGPLGGTIKAIPSKSQAHRFLICAALAKNESRIICETSSRDIEATADCLRALGAEIEYSEGVYTVKPIKRPAQMAELDCGESGSTLRFLLPVVCALGCGARIKMHGRLPERPLSPLWEELERCGAELTRPEKDIIEVRGRLWENSFSIAANVSSQYISGLLFALAIMRGGEVELLGDIESAGYIEMTIQALIDFGAHIELEEKTLRFSTPGLRSKGEMTVEGDWSNGAFWMAAGMLSGGKIHCSGLDMGSAQGDAAVIEASEAIMRGNATIDARDIPDLVPVLAVLASVSPGTTRFINAGRLRLKESDRLRTVTEMLKALGGDIEETGDGLILRRVSMLKGGIVDAHGDHRIAMSAAVAAIASIGEVTVENAECVSKSYPAFWEDYALLGGRVRLEE